MIQIAKLVSATVGDGFFRSLTEHLAKAANADVAYIAEIVDAAVPKLRALAVYPDSDAIHDLEQDLSGSAAARVLIDGSLAWSKDMRRLFPADAVLERLEAEGYAGVRLSDSTGQVIGLIALVSRDHLQNAAVAKSVVGVFAPRAAAELERKRSDDSLRESEERYRAFISRSTDAMWRIELAKPVPLDASEADQIDRIFRDGYLAECNDAMAGLAGGRSAEDLIGTRVSALFGDMGNEIRHELLEAARSGYSASTILTTPRGPNGRTSYRLRTQCGIVENNELRRIWGTTRDITDLKMAELAVEASERRFREVLEKIRLPALMLDHSGVITFCNDALVRIANWAGELCGREWLELIHDPRERETWAALLSKDFAEDESQLHFEGALRSEDGSRLLEWDAIILRDIAGESVAVAAVGRDITDQRLLEKRLAKAGMLEAIGRMGAGVAHDLNGFLTLIMFHVEFGLSGLEPETPLYKTLTGIRNTANDCAALTQQLLAIGKRQQLRPELLNLNSLIESQVDALQRIIGPNIELVKELDPRIGCVWADPVQIRRILTNLATNSRDAMPHGGSLTIATDNLDVEAASDKAVDPGPYVRMTVADSGSGLDDEVKQHLFEPFFTTKGPGRGVGLGLTTVYGIVSQSGGHISIRSSTTGTAIEILLPRRAEEPSAEGSFV